MVVSSLIKAACAAALLTSLFGAVGLAESSTPLSLNLQRQLFVDDFVIEETFAIERTMLQPKKHADNPIMSPKMPWEGGFLHPVMTLYAAKSQEFRMWYRAWASIKPPVARYLCYATSRDGINWERPNLGLVKFRGSKDNNIVQSRPDMVTIYDPRDPDPSRRYKSVGRFDTEGLCVAFSPDGLQWTNYEKNPVIEKIGDSNTLLGWDDIHKTYVGYFRPYCGINDPIRKEFPVGGLRRITRSTSDDFIHWSPTKMVLEPDDHDPVGTQFYEMYVTQYEGVYFGTVAVLHIDRALQDYQQTDAEALEQTMDAQLAFSRDGIHWTRLGSRQPWLSFGPSQSWDDLQAYPQPLIVVGNEIWVYYYGANVRHQVKDLRLSGERVDGRWRGARIGLVKLRRDGWVVARPEPGAGEAWIVTKPMTFEGGTLWVNADAQDGSLRVEVLDDQHRPIPGYERENCKPIAKDATATAVQWQDANLLSLAGRPVRFKFYLNGASLYSFWCDGAAGKP